MSDTKVVFLDVDDTLVDFASSNLAVFNQLFGGLDFGAWTALTAELYPRFTAGELDFADMREIRMTRFLESSGHSASRQNVRAAEQKRIEILDASYVLFEDVLPCLEALRAGGLRLGLITNNEPEHQRRKLATTRLSELFDVIVISGEVGVAKPKPAIFEHACVLIDVEPADCVHVGDNVDTDVYGALGAGMGAVWLDRRSSPADRVNEVRALGAAVIPGLADLAGLVLAPVARGHTLESHDAVR